MLKKFLVASSTLVEWFDFVIFVYLSSYISDYFLSSLLSKDTKEIIVLALIIIPYILRPLGGLFLGYMSDKLERKYILLITILMMGIGSMGIILIPSYTSIGIIAVILLLFFRMLQAFSIGGEYIVATIILYEDAAVQKRYSSTSLITVSVMLGSLLGILLIQLLLKIYTAEQIKAWYWKVPFIVSSILLCMVWYLRKISFTKLYSNNKTALGKKRIKTQKNIIALFFYLMFGGIGFYFFVVMGKSILLSTGLNNGLSTFITSIGFLALLLATPLAGYMADRYGPFKPQAIGMILTLFFSILYKYILLKNILIFSIISEIMLGAMLALYLGVMPGFMASLLPAGIRGAALGIVYNLALSIFGALTPLIIVLLLKHYNYGDVLYLMIASLISLIALYIIKKNNAYF